MCGPLNPGCQPRTLGLADLGPLSPGLWVAPWAILASEGLSGCKTEIPWLLTDVDAADGTGGDKENEERKRETRRREDLYVHFPPSSALFRITPAHADGRVCAVQSRGSRTKANKGTCRAWKRTDWGRDVVVIFSDGRLMHVVLQSDSPPIRPRCLSLRTVPVLESPRQRSFLLLIKQASHMIPVYQSHGPSYPNLLQLLHGPTGSSTPMLLLFQAPKEAYNRRLLLCSVAREFGPKSRMVNPSPSRASPDADS
ncbi:hypothetical protein B0J15DRAFT_521841 [Fusarium solani]|uniref:Uncharacterized protein n=1 Tax=Fusarium solani TaxID=169388 RepID=A0A9P9RB31_FUSSL|nr:uncharacterized protein B0J15DRAFT_521841 [Fusarium solani]KAH7273021.1 hypothetical protein B0J15DRAFT_521841 [Fusarium solani]